MFRRLRKGPGARSWGSWAGRAGCCVLGHDHTVLPSRQSHPCDSLSSQETWHRSCEIKISRPAHSKLQVVESWESCHRCWGLGPSRWLRQWGWSLGQTERQEDVLQWQASCVFLRKESNVPRLSSGELAKSCFRVRHCRIHEDDCGFIAPKFVLEAAHCAQMFGYSQRVHSPSFRTVFRPFLRGHTLSNLGEGFLTLFSFVPYSTPPGNSN